jgi:hypothetical protein
MTLARAVLFGYRQHCCPPLVGSRPSCAPRRTKLSRHVSKNQANFLTDLEVFMLARRLGGGRRLDVRTRRTLSCTMERERGKLGEGERARNIDRDVTITITPAVAPQLSVFRETFAIPLSILSLGRRAVCCHSDQVCALLNVFVRSEPDSACVCFIEQTLVCSTTSCFTDSESQPAGLMGFVNPCVIQKDRQ